MTRTQAITMIFGVIVAAAEEVGATPVEILEIETGGREALLTLGVTPAELAAAARVVAEI